MIIECPGCHTQFYLNVNNPSQTTLKLRCSQCRKVFSSTLPQTAKSSAEDQSAPKASSVSAQVKTEPARNAAPTGSKGLPEEKTAGNPGHIIAIGNQKGGVAKTSTCLNLGMALAAMQKRVLLVDFDIQGNLTASLGERADTSLYNAARKEKMVQEKKAAEEKAARQKGSEKTPRQQRTWQKKCPKCDAEVHVRKKVCACGHNFLGK